MIEKRNELFLKYKSPVSVIHHRKDECVGVSFSGRDAPDNLRVRPRIAIGFFFTIQRLDTKGMK